MDILMLAWWLNKSSAGIICGRPPSYTCYLLTALHNFNLDDRWPFELKWLLLSWRTFTPILVFLCFLVLKVRIPRGTDDRQTDGRTAGRIIKSLLSDSAVGW